MSGIRKVQNSAEALTARHRNEKWFIAVCVEKEGLVLLVYSSCPFTSHRNVEGHPVIVRVARVFKG